jgi:hypothetical protein
MLPVIAAIVTVRSRGRARASGWRAAVASVPWSVLIGAGLIGVLQAVIKAPASVIASDWWMPSLTVDLAARSLGEVAGLALVIVGLAWLSAVPAVARWGPMAAGVVLYWGTIAAISVVWTSIWWPRVLVPVVPMLWVSAAVAVSASPTPARRLLVALVLSLSALNAWQWIGRDARQGIEPWQAALAEVTASTSRPFVVAVPQYVDLVLRQVTGLDPSRIARIGAGVTDDDLGARLAPAMDAMRRGAPVVVAVRVDTTLARDAGLPVRIVEQLKSSAGDAGTLDVVLLLAPDASLIRDLSTRFDDLDAALAARFGPARRRAEGAGWRRLTF